MTSVCELPLCGRPLGSLLFLGEGGFALKLVKTGAVPGRRLRVGRVVDVVPLFAASGTIATRPFVRSLDAVWWISFEPRAGGRQPVLLAVVSAQRFSDRDLIPSPSRLGPAFSARELPRNRNPSPGGCYRRILDSNHPVPCLLENGRAEAVDRPFPGRPGRPASRLRRASGLVSRRLRGGLQSPWSVTPVRSRPPGVDRTVTSNLFP